MPRARNIKPAFFENELLGEMSCETRLLFIGLWTLADREGRLENRPRRIAKQLFPYDDFEIEPLMDNLASKGFLLRYNVDAKEYFQIVNFAVHQKPHYKEKESNIPAPSGYSNSIIAKSVTRAQRATIYERDSFQCVICSSKESLSIDHILPISRGGNSEDENLQTLCMSCNTKKGNKLHGELSNIKKDGLSKTDVEATLNRTRKDVGSILEQKNDASPSDSLFLIPDSLFLIPDCGILKPENVQKEFERVFDIFWQSFPKNNRSKGSSKDAKTKLVIALKKDSFENIMLGVKKYANYIRDTGQSNKDAFRWLEKEGWRDDYTIQSYASSGSKKREYEEAAVRGMLRAENPNF